MIRFDIRICCQIVLLLVLVGMACPMQIWAATTPAAYKAAILIDDATGQILFEENAHVPLYPASMVKMMVLFLAMEQLEAGRIHLTDQVTASEWAAHMGGQQVHLAKGETFTLQELLDAMVIASANDAAVAVAEYLYGDVERCVIYMNARARYLGMNETTFANVHGLPPGKGQVDNVTTAYDIAILGRALLHNFPQVVDWTSTRQRPFRNNEMTLVNTNSYLLRRFPGVDGLKTGYHRGSGYNVCVTAKQEDHRIFAVIMGAPSELDRNRAAKALLTQGFTTIKNTAALRNGQTETVR